MRLAVAQSWAQAFVPGFLIAASCSHYVVNVSAYLSVFIGITTGMLLVLLSPPYEGVGKEHYCTPRRFLLTGCASGMGRHLATVLLKQGHYVCATDINMRGLDEAFGAFFSSSHRDRLLVRELDVREPEQWQALVQQLVVQWGGLDVLMNIAGYLMPQKIQDASLREIDLHIDINVKGVVLGTKAASEVMLSQDASGGHIINVASMAAVATVSGVTMYACSKFACRGFSLAASKDFRGTKVSVSCLMPDAVQTAMVDLQLHYEASAMAFSGSILTVQDVEKCVMDHILPNRPVEVWLSPRARVARFGDIFGTSRAVMYVEKFMVKLGKMKQAKILASAAAKPKQSPPQHHNRDAPNQRAAKRSRSRGRSRSKSRSRSARRQKSQSKTRRGATNNTTSTDSNGELPQPKLGGGRRSSFSIRRLLKALSATWLLVTLWNRVVLRQPTALQVAKQFQDRVQGKHFLITGGSSGVGMQAARALYLSGGHVVITSRDEERGLSAVQSLIEAREGSEESEESKGSIRFEQLDLASLQSVDELVGRLSDGSEKGVFLGNLDCLINNAGMIAPHFSRTVDGMEAVLQVNHVGHQYLTQQVLATAAGKTHPRVVSVSSWHGAAWFAPSYCDTLQLSRESYGMFTAYGVSKLANVRFVRHLATMGIEALAVHPGMVGTELGVPRTSGLASVLQRVGSQLFWLLLSPIAKTPSQGAASIVFAALAPLHKPTSARGWKTSASALVSGSFVDSLAPLPFLEEREREKRQWSLTEKLVHEALAKRLQKTEDPVQESEAETGAAGENWKAWSPRLSLTDTILLLLVHPLVYYVAFSVAHRLLQDQSVMISVSEEEQVRTSAIGGVKINTRLTSPVTLKREKRRVLQNSSLVDGLYAIFIAHFAPMPSHELASNPVYWVVCALVLFLWGDAHFYFTHRLLHTPWLYKNVHSLHHESVNPGPWSSVSFHWIEAVVFFSTYLIGFVLPLTPTMWAGFKLTQAILGPLGGHHGYQENESERGDGGKQEGSWLFGAKHHYHHHTLKNVNFGGWPSGVWDKLLGTEHEDRLLASQSEVRSTCSGTPLAFGTAARAGLVLCLGAIVCAQGLRAFNTALVFPFIALDSPVQFFLGMPAWAVVILAITMVWVALLDGMLVIPPPGPRKETKVFVIGLSRTGTTSITAALNLLGWRTHHFHPGLCSISSAQCPRPAASLSKQASDSFDGHTDIAPSLVFRQLAAAYPTAKFVFTTRDKTQWAKAMQRFAQREPHKSLFRLHPVASKCFSAMYSSQWHRLTEAGLANEYEKHEREVEHFFSDQQHRFLRLDVTRGGPHLWRRLGQFLGAGEEALARVGNSPFPHKYVFTFSAVDQPLLQLKDLLRHIARWFAPLMIALTVCLLLVFPGNIFDYSQCNRACRKVNGGFGRPVDATAFSNWDSCICDVTHETPDENAGMATRINNPVTVDRYYPADNWTWPYTTDQVCCTDGTQRPAHQAAELGLEVTNCGLCGKCSNVESVQRYAELGEGMTGVATACAVGLLFGGEGVGRACVNNVMGLHGGCGECWLDNMGCTATHCFKECVLGREGNAFFLDNNPDGGTQLSECLTCDELHCSHVFLRCAGANRRTAGVETDIKRTDGEVCQSVTVHQRKPASESAAMKPDL